MLDFNGVTGWVVDGQDAVLTVQVRIPLARINNCLIGKQLKAADKVTDAGKAFTTACFTSARGAIAKLLGTTPTKEAQQFSIQLQVFASAVPLTGSSANSISPAEYALLVASGGQRV